MPTATLGRSNTGPAGADVSSFRDQGSYHILQPSGSGVLHLAQVHLLQHTFLLVVHISN